MYDFHTVTTMGTLAEPGVLAWLADGGPCLSWFLTVVTPHPTDPTKTTVIRVPCEALAAGPQACLRQARPGQRLFLRGQLGPGQDGAEGLVLMVTEAAVLWGLEDPHAQKEY